MNVILFLFLFFNTNFANLLPFFSNYKTILPYLCLYFMSIRFSYNFFYSSWNEDVAFFKHKIFACICLSAWESNNSAGIIPIIFELLKQIIVILIVVINFIQPNSINCRNTYFRINTFSIIYTALSFYNTNTHSAGSCQISHRV